MKEEKIFVATPLGLVAMVGLLVLAALSLTGCAEPEAIVAVTPTATVYAPPPTDAPPPTPEPTPVALSFPLPAPEQVVVEPVAVDSQTCVDCHTDEETLKAVQEEEVQEESLSEGEG